MQCIDLFWETGDLTPMFPGCGKDFACHLGHGDGLVGIVVAGRVGHTARPARV